MTAHHGGADGGNVPLRVLTLSADLSPADVDHLRSFIAQVEAVAGAERERLREALGRVMRNVVCGTWYDDPANDPGSAAVNRLHDAEREMWRLYDEFGIDPGDAYTRDESPHVHRFIGVSGSEYGYDLPADLAVCECGATRP